MLELIGFIVIICVVFGVPTGSLIANSDWLFLTDAYGNTNTDGLISEGSFRVVRCRCNGILLGLSVELYPTGLWLRLAFPFRLFVHSVLIPWSNITAKGAPDHFGSGIRMTFSEWGRELEIAGAPGTAFAAKLNGV